MYMSLLTKQTIYLFSGVCGAQSLVFGRSLFVLFPLFLLNIVLLSFFTASDYNLTTIVCLVFPVPFEHCIAVLLRFTASDYPFDDHCLSCFPCSFWTLYCCPSSIYGFWLPLWRPLFVLFPLFLLNIVLLPFFDLRLLITPLVSSFFLYQIVRAP